MSFASAQRLALALVALVVAAAIVLGGAAAGTESSLAADATAHPLLGITGNAARFKDQTGQDSSVSQAFLGWGQGQSYGAPFAGLFPTLAPIPMLTSAPTTGTDNEAITPGGDRRRQGRRVPDRPEPRDRELGKGDLRPADGRDEQLNNAFYGGFNANGTPKDAAHAPARYREAFARIYVILHGGDDRAPSTRSCRALGLPPVQGEEPLANPFPRSA